MNRVVITGMGVVSPIGNDVNTYWKSLKNGVSGIGMITRFDTSDYKTKVAAQVKGFDPQAYMSKGEVRKNDLFAQYAMAAASQAIEESGIQGKADPYRIGTYMGSGIGGIGTFAQEEENLLENGPKKVSPFFLTKLISNIAGGIISIKYGFKGASVPVVTACATGNNAIGEAYRAIRHGYLDAVVAGGAEAAIIPLGIAGFANMKALSPCADPENACIPFDIRRNGFVMGEGAGALVLEEYGHALKRGAVIYAELSGYGVTSDAHHITAPDPEGSGGAAALKMAYDEASGHTVPPEKIYINAHGTSTPANDRIETLAIKKGMGEEAARKLAISATKSMTGHMLGAAGAAEAIASIMALRTGIIPPTIGYKQPDPECDLDYTTNQAKARDLQLVLSASLGFGGHNAYLAFTKPS